MTEKRMPKQSLGQAYGAYPSTCPNDYYRRQKLGQPNEELDFGGDRNM